MQHGGVITSPHSSTNLKQLMHISTEFFIEGQTMKVVNTQKRQELFLWTDDGVCFDENLVELGGHMSTKCSLWLLPLRLWMQRLPLRFITACSLNKLSDQLHISPSYIKSVVKTGKRHFEEDAVICRWSNVSADQPKRMLATLHFLDIFPRCSTKQPKWSSIKRINRR